MIRHLIEVHGYKRIAFIRGPQRQLEADQRFEAYKRELEAHNIPFDDRIVVEGNYSPESGRAAVRTLLDERGLRIQAIAASNDRMAFGAIEVLQQRGIQGARQRCCDRLRRCERIPIHGRAIDDGASILCRSRQAGFWRVDQTHEWGACG